MDPLWRKNIQALPMISFSEARDMGNMVFSVPGVHAEEVPEGI
jgi:hypothetical protein